MSKEMREHIDKFKDFLLNEGKKVGLSKNYNNVIFSEDFYKQDENGNKIFSESSFGWCYNSKGFIPYRYIVENNIKI